MPRPKLQEFKLKRPDGGEVVLVIPPEVLAARRAIQPGEEQLIVDSMFGRLGVETDKLERAKAVSAKRELKFYDIKYAPLIPPLQARRLREQHLNFKDDGRGLDELMEDWNQRRCDPKLRKGVIELAQDSNGILFEHEQHALTEVAVTQALWAHDDEFFRKLGGAFARARKARKANLNRESLAHLPQQPKPSPCVGFLLDWWLTEDGLGPQLCLFTDQAIGDLLGAVFVRVSSKDWGSYASKIRQRMRLRSAKRKVVVAVRSEALKTPSRSFIRQDKTRLDYTRYVLVAAG